MATQKSVERTSLQLSLTVDEKKALKQLALDNETTVAGLIRSWLQEKLKEAK